MTTAEAIVILPAFAVELLHTDEKLINPLFRYRFHAMLLAAEPELSGQMLRCRYDMIGNLGTASLSDGVKAYEAKLAQEGAPAAADSAVLPDIVYHQVFIARDVNGYHE